MPGPRSIDRFVEDLDTGDDHGWDSSSWGRDDERPSYDWDDDLQPPPGWGDDDEDEEDEE